MYGSNTIKQLPFEEWNNKMESRWTMAKSKFHRENKLSYLILQQKSISKKKIFKHWSISLPLFRKRSSYVILLAMQRDDFMSLFTDSVYKTYYLCTNDSEMRRNSKQLRLEFCKAILRSHWIYCCIKGKLDFHSVLEFVIFMIIEHEHHDVQSCIIDFVNFDISHSLAK